MLLLPLFFSIALRITCCIGNLETTPWYLPVVPASLPAYPNYLMTEQANDTNIFGKKIPRLMWIGYRKAPTKLSDHMELMKKNNPDWKIHKWGHDEKDLFMETYFANTSTLWALKALNPAVGVSHADLWRYCILWAFGGYYSDDDSFIGIPLSDVVKEIDSMIITPEKGSYSECYLDSYKLSKRSINAINVGKKKLPSSYDRPIAIWALFSEPGNLVLENAIKNVVDIIRNEYFRRSVIHIAGPRACQVFCSTGPVFFLSSLRQFAVSNPDSPHLPRITKKIEFSEYEAIGKVYDDEVSGSDHYTNKMARLKLNLLHSYANKSVSLSYLESVFVVADLANIKSVNATINYRRNIRMNSVGILFMPPGGQGMGFYRVMNGHLVVYPDYCTFLQAYLSAQRPIEVVDARELHALFKFNSTVKGVKEGPPAGAFPSLPTAGTATTSTLSTHTSGNPSVIFAPPQQLLDIVVTANNKAFYLLKECVRYGFPNHETFVSLGHSYRNATVIPRELLFALPHSGDLPAVQ